MVVNSGWCKEEARDHVRLSLDSFDLAKSSPSRKDRVQEILRVRGIGVLMAKRLSLLDPSRIKANTHVDHWINNVDSHVVYTHLTRRRVRSEDVSR